MVFWFCGIMVVSTFTKILLTSNPILEIENSTILPKHHKTTIPSWLQFSNKNNMHKNLLLVLFLFISFYQTQAQKLVEATLLETQSAEQLNLIFGFLGVSVEYGVNTYKILYETPDTDGTIDTASGILVLPILDTDLPAPIVAYQHGTVSTREDVPSRLTREAFLVYFFAGNGFISIAADYIGLGDSRRVIHPYVHADTEASAAIDLLRASKEYMAAEGVSFSEQLFITGYSQGGHAAMAMHKEIETNLADEFTVTAGSHMSGPYNLSNTIINTSLEDSVYEFPSYLAWMFVGYQSVYQGLYEDLGSVFQPEFIPAIEDFTNGEISLGELNDFMVEKLIELHGSSFANRIFLEEFLIDLQTNPTNPIRLALEDNDLIDWVPTAPTQLLYCMADEQVPFTNATITDSIMNANGAAAVTSIDIDSALNHGECVIPATENTFNFFLQFVEPVDATTSVRTISEELSFIVHPNPASQRLFVRLKDNEIHSDLTAQLISLEGKIIIEQSLATNNSINLSTIPSGFYMMRLQSEKGYWVEKVTVNK